MAELPEGWTDDLTIPLQEGQTMDELVEFIIQALLGQEVRSKIEQDLMTIFKLSEDDADLARDRTLGGIVRAATKNPENCPHYEKDPVAWTSFHRATLEPSIIAAIYPKYAD